MPNVVDAISADVLFQDLELLRVEQGMKETVLRLLRDLERQIERSMRAQSRNPLAVRAGIPRTQRIERLRKRILRLSQEAYGNIDVVVKRELEQVVLALGDDTQDILNQAVGFQAVTQGISTRRARSIAQLAEAMGTPTREWWDAEARGIASRFVQQIRDGARADAATIDDLVARTIGTRRNKLRDGVAQVSRRQAQTIVATAMQSVTNETRYALYREHSDVIVGVQASNPLDSRTTEICMARAGQAWVLATGQPFPGSFEPFPGNPPWHWNCRTVLVPIFRSVGDLSKMRGGRGRGIRRQLERAGAEKRAGLDGKPATGLSLRDVLKTRDDAFLREALGPSKFKLWKEGRISPRDLIDQQGRALSVAELRERFGQRRRRSTPRL